MPLLWQQWVTLQTLKNVIRRGKTEPKQRKLKPLNTWPKCRKITRNRTRFIRKNWKTWIKHTMTLSKIKKPPSKQPTKLRHAPRPLLRLLVSVKKRSNLPLTRDNLLQEKPSSRISIQIPGLRPLQESLLCKLTLKIKEEVMNLFKVYSMTSSLLMLRN